MRRKLRAQSRRSMGAVARLLFDDAALARGRFAPKRWLLGTAALAALLLVAVWSGVAAAVWWQLRGTLWSTGSHVLVRFPISEREALSPVDHAGLLPAALPVAAGNSSLPVFVIASCYNRLPSLQSCLPTWLALPEVTNVLIIDWASDKAIHHSLDATIAANDGRLRVVRLEHPSPFTLPTSVNLGLHFFPLDRPSLLLKVDCDTLLLPGFIEHHPMTEDVYYAGDWRVARSENELHLNGVLFIHTQTFLAVNGYDERLQSYGYDDSNLHERLATRGLKQLPMRYDFIEHQWHDDSVRTLSDAINSKARRAALRVADVNALTSLRLEPLLAIASPFFATQRHRILLDAVPSWGRSMVGVQFSVHRNASVPHVYFTRLNANIAPIEDLASPANATHAINEAAQIALRRLGFQVDQLDSALYHDSKYLMRLLTFYYTDSEMPSLVIDVQNGLSNRLRALASAAAVAAELQLALKVIWLPDHHCQAKFSDLFRIAYEVNASLPREASAVQRTLHALRAHLVWEDTEWSPMAHLLTDERFDLYDYMEQQPGDIKDAPIVAPKAERSLYVKSAYRLNSDTGYDDERLSQALGSLLLAEPLLERLNLSHLLATGPVTATRAQESLQSYTQLIGLHVRHQAPSKELQTLRTSEYMHSAWLAMAEARNLTTLSAYSFLLKAALKSHPSQRFYVTTDTPSVVDDMRRRYGDSAVVTLAGEPCLDRSVGCVQRALADQLLLGSTQRVFGSVWSSFSEVAGLWRRTPVDYPPDVQQRVDALLQQLKHLQAKEAARASPSFGSLSDDFRAAYISPQLLAAGPMSSEVQSRALSPAARASGCRLTRLSLLGERCSGTGYLQQLLERNFNLTLTHDYHYKHFFGFEDSAHPLADADCTLFVSVVRHPVDWLDSLFKYQWQLDQWRYPTWRDFLTQPIVSYVESEMNQTLNQLPEHQRAAARQEELKRELWHDRNFADPKTPHWKDVFQLRSTKLRYMVQAYPAKVQHYAFVRLEDLARYHDAFLAIIADWFNVRPRVFNAGLASFVDGELDHDVVATEEELRGRAHEHLPDALMDFVWQHLDAPLEAALGYHRNNSRLAKPRAVDTAAQQRK